METLVLHEFHRDRGARFTEVNGAEAVEHYGNSLTEYQALSQTAGFLDFSFRGRLCLTGADRIRFLHGQVTNDIKALRSGAGCYAAVVNAKGRMEADVNVYCLEDELLLDFEPGLTPRLIQRLEKYIVADDVQVVDVAALCGLLTVQGPAAREVVRRLGIFDEIPAEPFRFLKKADRGLGEIYLLNQRRLGTSGFDLLVPSAALEVAADKLVVAAAAEGGRPAGWSAFEISRVEAGIPRFGVDMDEANFPQEAGIEARAVSYTKGCYIGQEVLNRIHTLGHVNRTLCGVRLARDGPQPLARHDRLFREDKEIGYITSIVDSPKLDATIALGYVRKEAQVPRTEVIVRTAVGGFGATIVSLPFR